MIPSWNPDLVADMVKAGWSASVIAAAFHITRNAAIGRMHRDPELVKLWAEFAAGRIAGPNPPRRPKPEPVAAEPPKKPSVGFLLKDWGAWEEREMKPRPVRPKSLNRLKSGECKWPVKDAPDITGGYLFCSMPTEAGSSYCAKHNAKARPGRSA